MNDRFGHALDVTDAELDVLRALRRDLMTILPYSDEDVETSLVVSAERLSGQIKAVKALRDRVSESVAIAAIYGKKLRPVVSVAELDAVLGGR